MNACPILPPDDIHLSPEIIHRLPETLRCAQSVFDRTGGLHAAARFDLGGKLECLREDSAALLELRTCSELPYDLAALRGAPLDYPLKIRENLGLGHPLVPIALVKWYTSLSPIASGPVTTAVVISGYVAE